MIELKLPARDDEGITVEGVDLSAVAVKDAPAPLAPYAGLWGNSAAHRLQNLPPSFSDDDEKVIRAWLAKMTPKKEKTLAPEVDKRQG